MSGIMWQAKARPTTAVKSDVMRSRLGHLAAAAEQCATSEDSAVQKVVP